MPEVTGVISQVDVSHGKRKNGDPWTKYGVNMGNDWFSTFDGRLGRKAQELKDEQTVATVRYDIDGKFQNITGIEEAEEGSWTFTEEAGPGSVGPAEWRGAEVHDDPPMTQAGWRAKERREHMRHVWSTVYIQERGQGRPENESKILAMQYAVEVDEWLMKHATQEAPF